MKILDLEVMGVRALRDGASRIDPGPLTVVTGPPGVGLTTFLDAIAFTAARLAVGGVQPAAEDIVRAGGTAATITTTWAVDADERAYGGMIEETTQAEVIFRRGELGRADADPGLLGLMSRYDSSPSLSKVVAIPARRQTDGALSAFTDFDADQRYKRLALGPEKFVGLPHILARHGSGRGDRARFDDVQRLFADLCTSVRLAGVSNSGELEFAPPSGPALPLRRLGFGERNAFVLAALPVLMGLQRSVVLLDTPEMGLPPGLAARWMDALRGYTPEAQWIVASRDPVLAAGDAPRVEITRRAA